VNEWAAFEEKHPSADIEDFCRSYLAHRRRQKEQTKVRWLAVWYRHLVPGY